MRRPLRASEGRFVPGLSRSAERSGPAWWFLFRRRELLVDARECRPLRGDEGELPLAPTAVHFVGELEGMPCFAAEVAPEASPPPGLDFRDLRLLFGRLDDALHDVAGRAVQLVEWDRTHRFCGACGAPTAPSPTERSRLCGRCGLPHFPRLAPAIIVAVEREDELLLARGPQFPPGIFSVLAGFVEPGESVEEAVVREVREEAGIALDELRWFGSQPWPFPHSLMLGFQARYAGGELAIDGVELSEAGWFRADAMPPLFPGNVSIAQWLIHDFLERHTGSRGPREP